MHQKNCSHIIWSEYVSSVISAVRSVENLKTCGKLRPHLLIEQENLTFKHSDLQSYI